MKLGILTHYFGSANYGGNLQAYALCKVLEGLGYEAQQVQIDHSTCYQNLLSPKKRGLKQQLKQLVKPIVGLLHPGYRRKWQAKEATRQRLQAAFHRFNRQLIPHSQQVYTPKNIHKALGQYDAFITGSDQVWNPIWFFPPYFLDFVPAGIPKLSYAASIGQTQLPEAVQAIYRQHLKDYLAVSVREEDAVTLLEGIAPEKPAWVLDPTLLLSRKQWQEVAQMPKLETPYVFCYFLGNDPVSRRLAADFAKAKGLTLVTIPNATGLQNSNDAGFGDVRLADPSPEAFLGLIEKADYIFTDSFHATAFSLIFGRQFYTFPRQGHGKMGSRVTSLTGLFGAEARFCDAENKQTLSYLESLPEISYDAPTEAFLQAREESLSFLKTSLQKAKEMLAL